MCFKFEHLQGKVEEEYSETKSSFKFKHIITFFVDVVAR